MKKTMKVLDINNNGIRFICIKEIVDEQLQYYNLYRLEWRDRSWHRKRIFRTTWFGSVVRHIADISETEMW